MKTNGTCNDVLGETDTEAQSTLMGASKEVEERSEKEERHCGLGSCQPKWARMFESTHVFMVVFLSGWVLQGVFYTYFVSVITTIEKLFRIKSKTTGTLLATTEVGQICTALFLTYFAGRGHRPRWIACGMMLFALGCFGCALPHFVYGSKLLESSLVIRGGNSGANFLDGNASHGVCGDAAPSEQCEAHIYDEQQAHSEITSKVLPVFFLCLGAVGIGQTAISTLGIPYIDDNVASKESPLYIAITIGVRIVGPAGGFILGSFCTRLYADLTSPVGLQPGDPQWVGAWWLGLLLVSSLLFLMGLCMFCFPPQLPSPKNSRRPKGAQSAKSQSPKRPQLKDFPKTLKRQLYNDILMFRTVSCVLHLLPVAGFFTFLPKYLESQFRLPTHDANLISGIGGILVMGVGIMLSGAVILKIVPTARFVSGWTALTALVYSAGVLILMFVGCPMDDMVGLNYTSLSSDSSLPQLPSTLHHHSLPATTLAFTQTPSCHSSCTCDKNKFDVVCGQDGRTYFSPCHAGCMNVSYTDDKRQYFNCQCINTAENSTNHGDWWSNAGDPGSLIKGGSARAGYCEGDCHNFVLFICIFSFVMFVHASGEVGSILLIMRCTDPKDKAMAMGIIQFAIGLFGNVPCPIIFGAVVDSTCLIWDSVCNTKGACVLYDSNVFRHFFLGTTGGIMGLAFLVDLVVWYKAGKIDINPEDSIDEGHTKTLPQDISTTPLTIQQTASSDTAV